MIIAHLTDYPHVHSLDGWALLVVVIWLAVASLALLRRR